MAKNKKRRGTGRVTLADVAKKAAVGTMTASRALRTPDQVSEKLRQQIEAAVLELGYIPNKAAGALASATSDMIVLILPSVAESANAELLKALNQELIPAGYQLILGYSNYSPQEEEKLIRSFLQYSPAAILLYGAEHTQQTLTYLALAQVPVGEMVEIAESALDINVGVNHFDSAYQLTKYLYMKGYREICFLGTRTDHGVLAQRLSGWQKAMSDHNMTSDCVMNCSSEPSFAAGVTALSGLLTRRANLDAVICSHSELAAGLIFECHRRGIAIPQDLAVAGFDDLDISHSIYPGLTCVDIPYQKIGKLSGQLLLKRLQGENTESLVTELAFKINARAST